MWLTDFFFTLLIDYIFFTEGIRIEYMHAEAGLYPAVHASQNAKQRDARLRKFEFIGRLLAQALIDARMVCFMRNRHF